MIFRNLDDNDDWLFGRGLNDFVDKNTAIGLNIKTRVLSWVNDCFFELSAGIDWINRLGAKNQSDLLNLDLKRIILQSQDVTGLNTISIDVTDRQFNVTYDISTVHTESFVNTISGVINA